MSIYHYNGASVIDDITLRTVANGSVRAYLHARDGTDPATIQKVKDSLDHAGLEWLSFTLDGKPVLEVRGFGKKGLLTSTLGWLKGEKQEDPLLKHLSQSGFVQGKPTVKEEEADYVSWGRWIRKNSLLLCGISMVIADTGFSIYGFKEAKIHKQADPKHRRDFSEMLAGFSYLGGSSLFLLYGRNDQSDLQVREMAELILQKGREKGLITDDTSAASLGGPRKENVFTKVDNFFREHPSEVGNMLYFTAGALIAQAALRNRIINKPRPEMSQQQIKEMRHGGWTELGLGSSTMASAAIAILGKEKKHDPDQPRKHGIDGLKDWVMSNPLAVASYGYMGSTLFHAWTTYNDRKESRRAVKDMKLSAKERFLAGEKTKSIPWRVLFIGMTLVGEFFLSISTKGHGQGVVSDRSVDRSAVAIAADLIVKQPLEVQDGLIDYMGKYLGAPDMLALGDEATIKQLREQVVAMRNNPWSQKPGAKKEQPVPATPSQNETPAWQAKLAAKENAVNTPQLSA